jgi:hypothetical protein
MLGCLEHVSTKIKIAWIIFLLQLSSSCKSCFNKQCRHQSKHYAEALSRFASSRMILIKFDCRPGVLINHTNTFYPREFVQLWKRFKSQITDDSTQVMCENCYDI